MTFYMKRVLSDDLREEVYALRYRAYRSVNALDSMVSERFQDKYDEQPNHILWALCDRGRLVGSIRTTWFDPAAPWTIPEMEGYWGEVERTVPKGQRILSGNRFVVDPENAGSDIHYAMVLLRFHMLLARQRADWALAAVRSNHLPFYKRVLRLEKVSDGRNYPGLKSVMYLTACETAKHIEDVFDRSPAMKPKGYERILLDESYQDMWEVGVPVEVQ